MGSVFSDKHGDQRVLHVAGDPGQLLDPDDAALPHRGEHRRRHQGVARSVPRPAAGRSSSRTGWPPPGCPDVPCTSRVDRPEIAAARCSDTQDFAVPGTPSSSSARSVARVATATSISRREPMYLGRITVPSGRVPPIR